MTETLLFGFGNSTPDGDSEFTYHGFILGGNPSLYGFDLGFDTSQEAKDKFLQDLEKMLNRFGRGAEMFWRTIPKLVEEKDFDKETLVYKYVGRVAVKVKKASAEPTVSEDDPTTVEELIAAMEKRFVCSVGYPGPYVFKSYDFDSTPRKYRYETYLLMGYADHPRTKENLVRSLWYAFKQYPEGARMYWRLDYKISMEDFEQTLADGWTPSGNMMTQIRTRVAFPFEHKA